MNSKVEKSFWRTGKDDYKKLMSIKLKTKTNLGSFLLGLLLTALIIFPIACVVFQVIELYWFSHKTIVLFLAIAWGLLMIANGLSNYITVKVLKAFDKEMTDIQNLDDKAIWFYHTLNPGFGAFMLVIMIFFWVSAS